MQITSVEAPAPVEQGNPRFEGRVPDSRSSRRTNLLACALMFVLAFVFMAPGWWLGRVAAPMEQIMVMKPWQASHPDIVSPIRSGDIPLQQLPWRHWAQDEMLAGRFPLWAPGPLGGQPLFAHYQTGALFPLHILWALMPVGVGFGIIMALKLWLAGVGMWGFLRAMDIHPAAALLSSLGFMFSAGMVNWLPWTLSSMLFLMPWLAWAIYCWCVWGKRGALLGLTVLAALSIFSGHPEVLFIVGLTVGMWAIGLLLGVSPRLWPGRLAGLAVAAIVGGALGAIQLLPFFEALEVSRTAQLRLLGTSLAPLRLDASMMLDWIVPRAWGHVPERVLGGRSGFTEANNYVGFAAIIGIGLAVVAGVRRRLNLRLALPMLAIGLFAWFIAYDDTLGITVRTLPGFSQSVNGRWVLTVGFAALTLSAFGWDWFARWVAGRVPEGGWRTTGWRSITGVALLVAGVAVLLAHAAHLFPQPIMVTDGTWSIPNTDYQLYWAIWSVGLVLAICGMMVLWASRWSGARFMPYALAALLVVDLWQLLITINPTASAEYYFPRTGFIDQMKALLPPAERVVAQGESFPANSGLIYNVRDWRAQDPMISERAFKAAHYLSPDYSKGIWTEYNMFFPTVNLPVAPALGIRYFISESTNLNNTDDPDPDRPNIKRLAYKDGLGLYEIEGVPGFTYLSDYLWVEPDEEGADHWLQRVTWAKMRAYGAVVEAPERMVESIQRAPDGSSPGSSTVREYSPGHIVLDVDAKRPALLVVAESYYPGWKATIDGEPAEVLRANFLSQGLVVTEGKHTVEFKYDPDSVRYGTLLSGVGVLGLLGIIWWAGPWRRARKA